MCSSVNQVILMLSSSHGILVICFGETEAQTKIVTATVTATAMWHKHDTCGSFSSFFAEVLTCEMVLETFAAREGFGDIGGDAGVALSSTER
jgi:hypothetical protein